jgi:hypothetical protein
MFVSNINGHVYCNQILKMFLASNPKFYSSSQQTHTCELVFERGNMKGENVACSLGALHYIVALTIIFDSIIFMSGFSPFFITKLTPTAYNTLIIYCITAGSLLFCHTKLASVWNKKSIELIISRRQQRAYNIKHRLFQTPKPTPETNRPHEQNPALTH